MTTTTTTGRGRRRKSVMGGAAAQQKGKGGEEQGDKGIQREEEEQEEEERAFVKMAEGMGAPVPWKGQMILKVRDLGRGSWGSGNSLSRERMPFHFDGVFKTALDSRGEVVPVPPRWDNYPVSLPIHPH